MDFAKLMGQLPDEKLWDIVQSDEDEYRAEAREAARAELRKRGRDMESAAELPSATGPDKTAQTPIDRILQGLQPEDSTWRELLSAGSLGVGVMFLYQIAVELAYRIALQRQNDAFFAESSLHWGAWFTDALIGTGGLVLGIWLWRRWRRTLGVLLVGFLAVSLLSGSLSLVAAQPGSQGFTLLNVLLSLAGIVAGFWLLRDARERQRQLQEDVIGAFE